MPLTVAQLVARLTADTSGFYRGMAIANSAMLRSGSVIGRVAAGAGLAVTGMGILSLRAAGNFEQSQNILAAVSSATTKQMSALRQEAIALGADMKLPNVSAKDASEAMQELAKGGLSVKQILGATRGTLQLGLAANIGFADSAVLVARALKSFNLNGGDAVKVADLFTAAANKSTAGIEDIALGFQQASARFSSTGQGIEDLATSIAIMADAGVIGSDAGTSLKTMLNRLVAPTEKAKDLMGDLGIRVYDAEGNMRSMPAIIGTLNKSMAGMGEEQRNAALYTIFGSDAIRAATILMKEGEKGFRGYREEITKGGEAQKYTEARTKGFNGALQAFGSAVETLAIQLGTALLPAATKVVRALSGLVAKIDAQRIIAFVGAIKDMVVQMYNFVSGSDAMVAAVAGLAAGLVAFKIMQTASAWITGMAGAFQVLRAAMIGHPIVLIVAALAALAAGLYLAYQRSETFRNIVNSAFSWLRDNVLPTLLQIRDAVVRTFNDIMATVRPIVTAIVNFIRTHWDTIRAVSQLVWNAIKAHIQTIWAIIRTVIQTALGVIQGIVKTVMAIIRGDWSAAWEGIKQIASSLWNGIKTLASVIFNGIKTTLANIFTAIWTVIKGKLTTLKNTIVEKFTEMVGFIKTLPGRMLGLAIAIGKAIVDGIVQGVGDLAGRVGGAIKGGLDGALGGVKGFLGIGSPSRKTSEEIGKPIAQGIIEGALLGLNEFPSKLSGKVLEAFQAVRSTIQEQQGVITNIFSTMTGDISSAFDAITQQTLTPTEKLLQKLISDKDIAEFNARLEQAKIDLQTAQAEMAALLGGTAGMKPWEVGYAAELEKKQGEIAAAQKALDDLLFQQEQKRLEAIAAEERKSYEAKREMKKREMEERLAELQRQLIEHPEKSKQIQERIIRLLKSYGITYQTVGQALGQAYAKGLKQSEAEILRVARGIAEKVAAILKVRSPTKEGPMSDLDHWWDGFASTLTRGLDTDMVERTAAGLAHVMRGSLGGATLAPQSAGAAVPYPTVVNITVEGTLVSQSELEDSLRTLFADEAARGRGLV